MADLRIGSRTATALTGVLFLAAGTQAAGDRSTIKVQPVSPVPAKRAQVSPAAGQVISAAQPKIDPREIWPAGLTKLAGRYIFAQVASPGGLWETVIPAGDGASTRRQVSLNEIPASLREKLTQAEIVISDLKQPSEIEASQRLSPSKRGNLRFYEEATLGKLSLRNLPGIGTADGDMGNYSGPVLYTLGHQSHSNPSVSGVLSQRIQQEAVWGVATLDYADLHATPLSPDGAQPNEEAATVIGNARILRSGVEIFAYVEWVEKDERAARRYTGAVRLVRTDEPAKPTEPVAGGKAAAE